MQPRIHDLNPENWVPLRPEIARQVLAHPILASGPGGVQVALARVAAGGEFPPHRDSYHHLFWFMEGEGEGILGEETYAIRPGRVVEVPAGTRHGYRNTGTGELLLLTANIPVHGGPAGEK